MGARAPRRRQGQRRHGAARLIALTLLVAAGLTASGTGRASAALAPDQPAGCPDAVSTASGTLYFPAEQYPPAGLPRNAAPQPYEIPFAGKMTGGVLKVGLGDSTVLGPANANLCGVFSLPNQVGTSTVDQLKITDNPVPVSVGSVDGVQLFSAYIQLTANITAQLNPQPAPNGGLNLTLQASFAGTLVPQAGLSGLLISSGLSSLPGVGTLTSGTALPVDGFECTTLVGPLTFTTQTSGTLTGKPITGPIDDAQTSLVANDFEYPAISASTPEVSTDPAPPAGSCSTAAATLFNTAVGLPQPPGNAQFTADATFAIHATA